MNQVGNFIFSFCLHLTLLPATSLTITLHMIIFQQDNYFEEAFKMRNVLEELLTTHHGGRKPTILGLREHIFTGRLV